MSAEQFITTQLLFAKHRKLYYLLSFSQDKIIRTIKDKLIFSSNVSHKDIINEFFESLYFVQQSDNDKFDGLKLSSNIVYYYNDGIQFDLLPNVDTLDNFDKNISVQSFYQPFNFSQLSNILTQEDITTIALKDIIGFDYDVSGKNREQKENHNQFVFSDQINLDKYDVDEELIDILNSENYNQIFTDQNNQLTIIKTNCKFKIFLDGQFLDDVFNIDKYGIIAKDVIFKNLKDSKFVLKLYNLNDVLIKSFQLKNIVDFDFKITNITKEKQKISFYSNYLNIDGYNIYHDNSILKKFHCNFFDRDGVFSQPIHCQVISTSNKNNAVLFENKSYSVFRFDFKKTVYLSGAFFEFNKKYNFKFFFRGDLVEETIENKKFQSLQLGFYCRFLDIRIEYQDTQLVQLNYIDLICYDIDSENSIHSKYQRFDSQNTILLNYENLVPQIAEKSCFVQYNGLLNQVNKVNNDSQRVVFNNLTINGQKNVFNPTNDDFYYFGYFSPTNYYDQASIQIALKPAAMNGLTNNGNYKYINIEYSFQDKQDTSVVQLKYFTMFGQSKNFPRVLVANVKKLNSQTYLKRMFVHITPTVQKTTIRLANGSSAVVNVYFQKWVYSQILPNNGIYPTITDSEARSYSNDYIAFVYYQDGELGNWKKKIQLKFNNSDTLQFSQQSVSFVNFDYTNGFIVNDNGIQYVVEKSYQYKCSNCGSLFYDNQSYMTTSSIAAMKCCGTTMQPQKVYYILPYYKIYTKSDAQEYQIIANLNDVFLIPKSGNQRDFKVVFKDGDDKRFKLYSIVFKQIPTEENTNYSIVKLDQDKIVLQGNDIQNDIEKDYSSVIYNNYYNVLYFINYHNSSKYSGKLIQSEYNYFDKSDYKLIQKSNIRFDWEKNQFFQYVVLFDALYYGDVTKYDKYFYNKHNRFKTKTLTQCCCDSFELKQCRNYYCQFDDSVIITKITSNFKNNYFKDLKIDCFYSYSLDGNIWSDKEYCGIQKCFCAKFLKIYYVIYGVGYSPQLFDDFSVDVQYLNGRQYYLAKDNFFDTIKTTQLIRGQRYLFLLMKFYNGQYVDSKLKLFYVTNNNKIGSVDKLYIDGNILQTDYDDSDCSCSSSTIDSIKISGIDRKCQFKFQTNVQNVRRFLISVFCQGYLIDQLNLYSDQIFDQYNGMYSFVYTIKQQYFKPFNIFHYNVIAFDDKNNVSEKSNNLYFYFNNLPYTPQYLGVSDSEVNS